MANLAIYKPIIKFISRFLGPEAEIVLYDTVKHEIFHVENPFNSNTKIGNKMRDLEQSFIDENLYKKKESIINYRAFSTDRKKLRSATHFIKNENDELTGMLTINYKVDELIEMRGLLNNLINGFSSNKKNEEEKFYESFNLSFEDLMNSTIQDALKKFNIPPDRLSYDEKMELIKILDEKGTFLIKGSVPELARILNTTETTIYRYINKL